jgi:farnesyl-diphosphate farnesyltransferase
MPAGKNVTVRIRELLKEVSRSFYLTLRVLPRCIRPSISLAYLLARTTDTIADSHPLPADLRLDALRRMRETIRAIAGDRDYAVPDLNRLIASQTAMTSSERILLRRTESTLREFRELPSADRERVHEVMEHIIRGQETDLVRFGRASADRIAALQFDDELDDYIYCVAGSVGEFWTGMCLAHLFSGDRLDDSALFAEGARYGKGLQLVNILRDLPDDLRQGRCYLPLERLSRYGLHPQQLLDPDAMVRLRPVYDNYLDRAEDLLASGWSYTLRLPARQARIRLACAWPILIGRRTLVMLRGGNPLDDRRRVKLRRPELYRWMLLSAALYWYPAGWRRLFGRAGDRRRFPARRGAE